MSDFFKILEGLRDRVDVAYPDDVDKVKRAVLKVAEGLQPGDRGVLYALLKALAEGRIKDGLAGLTALRDLVYNTEFVKELRVEPAQVPESLDPQASRQVLDALKAELEKDASYKIPIDVLHKFIASARCVKDGNKIVYYIAFHTPRGISDEIAVPYGEFFGGKGGIRTPSTLKRLLFYYNIIVEKGGPLALLNKLKELPCEKKIDKETAALKAALFELIAPRHPMAPHCVKDNERAPVYYDVAAGELWVSERRASQVLANYGIKMRTGAPWRKLEELGILKGRTKRKLANGDAENVRVFDAKALEEFLGVELDSMCTTSYVSALARAVEEILDAKEREDAR
ncbi:MAG: hypothetical protein QXP98_08145 [Thermoproteus sp.]